MDNVNPETNIPYGVVNANDLPYLYDEIFQNGTDHRYEAALSEIKEQLKGCETVDEVNAVVDEHHYSDEYYVDDMEFDLDELAGNLMETFECDDPHMSYKSDGYEYVLSGLYIFVCKSPFVATCRPCSPCMPNAGDLNSITDVHGGNVAYCFNPEDYKPDAEGDDKPVFVIDNETTPPTISLPEED